MNWQNTTIINFSLQLLTKMNNYLLEFTPLQFRTFITLCQHTGQPITQAEIARQTQATPAGIKKALEELERNNLITTTQGPTPNTQLIQLQATKNIKQLKQAYNLLQIHQTTLTQTLEEKHPGATIILFGSYSRGEDTIRSDIDIAILGSTQKKIDLNKQEQQLKRKITIQYYNNLKEIHKELQNNILNGITLAGAIHDTRF